MRGAGGRREVAAMAWPLAVGMLSFTLMGVVDTLVIGRVGTEAQAGVALATMLAFSAVSFFRGLTMGAQSLVAAADGAGDRLRVLRGGGAGVLTGSLSGLAAAALLRLFSEPLLALSVGEGVEAARVAAYAQEYLDVRALALPFGLMAFGLLAGLQGIGDTRARMWVSLVGNLLNGALDLLLVFGWGPVPALGVAGAAWATLGSSALMALLYGCRYWALFGRPAWPGRRVLRDSSAVGFPSGVQALAGVGSMMAINMVLARVGAVHLAASQIVLQVASVSFLPGFGLSEAGGVLVGRYLGQGRRRTAARALRSSRWLAVGLMGLFGLAFLVGGDVVAGLFTRDREVALLAAQLMVFAAIFQVFDAMAMAQLCALRGAGDTRFTLWVTMGMAWGVTVPLTLGLGLGLGWGATGAWLGLTLEIMLLAWVTRRRADGLRTGRVGRMDLLLG